MNGFKFVLIWKLGINGIEHGSLAIYWKFWRWNSFPWEVVRVQAKSLTWDFSPFYFGSVYYTNQRAKKVVSNSPGLMDFAIGLANSVLNLLEGQVKYLEEFNLQKNCEINSTHQKIWGAIWNDGWASKCKLQLAWMASCKNDFLCTLLTLFLMILQPTLWP